MLLDVLAQRIGFETWSGSIGERDSTTRDSIVSVASRAGIEVCTHEGDFPRALYAYPRFPGCGLIIILFYVRRSRP